MLVTRLIKVSNSVYVSIPKPMRAQLGWKAGDLCEISTFLDGSIKLRKLYGKGEGKPEAQGSPTAT